MQKLALPPGRYREQTNVLPSSGRHNETQMQSGREGPKVPLHPIPSYTASPNNVTPGRGTQCPLLFHFALMKKGKQKLEP